MAALQALWRFSRPHTIIGTSLSVWSIFVLVVATTPLMVQELVLPALIAWIACLLGNVYIVGLNQLWDVEIDRINKPNLPLASGEFTLRQGKGIVALCGLASILIAIGGGVWLGITIGSSLLIGTAYSMPPLRLKRFAFFAAFCILVVRGMIVNLGLYQFYSSQLNAPISLPAPIWGLTLFILIFSVGIAICKDLPDMEGDRQFHIQTLTIQIGPSKVFNLTRILMTISYGGLLLWAWLGQLGLATGINRGEMIVSQGVILTLFWWRSGRVDLNNKPSITQFYQFIWKLFFLQYLLYPLTFITGI